MYRDNFINCPGCNKGRLENAGPFERCNTCYGLWISEGVLASMMREMTGGHGIQALPFVASATAVDSGCPACRKRMTAVWLEDVEVERCVQHGVWFERKELQRALYHATLTKMHSGEAEGEPLGQTYLAHLLDRVGAPQIPEKTGLACPACDAGYLRGDGRLVRCTFCRGLWIDELLLMMLLNAIDHRQAEWPWEPAAEADAPERNCPVCEKAMAHVAFEGIHLERCADHGVWFDQHELETALHRVSASVQADGQAEKGRIGEAFRGFFSTLWEILSVG